MMFDRDEKTNIKSTVVILTPTSLMKHQVEFLKLTGITAGYTGGDQRDEEAKKAVEKAEVIARLLWDLQILTW